MSVSVDTFPTSSWSIWTARVSPIRLRDSSNYVEMAAKHFALLTDVVKIDVEQALLERLDRGRMRVAEATRKLLEAGQR